MNNNSAIDTRLILLAGLLGYEAESYPEHVKAWEWEYGIKTSSTDFKGIGKRSQTNSNTAKLGAYYITFGHGNHIDTDDPRIILKELSK
ncbi:MAG: hypothetical protein HRU18_02650 [Pseudoalteromonas sp.]|uniref:hypothetical protein n=1 Tax=Pseudoalteromonas sp. TaxID=53249 RepID=UPI001D398498|nr:hypothetical protein [Pseudoalteromonas sp.]NRA77083.1 hypothetical protein [Pseudoalteromonas sp.]